MTASAYLSDIIRTFRNYRSLGERALAQTPDAHLNTQLDPIDNSIAVIVKHVAGNLRSRYDAACAVSGMKARSAGAGESLNPSGRSPVSARTYRH